MKTYSYQVVEDKGGGITLYVFTPETAAKRAEKRKMPGWSRKTCLWNALGSKISGGRCVSTRKTCVRGLYNIGKTEKLLQVV
jgi:hypothetical protein